MKTKIIEVESANLDLWGKFMVGVFDKEWTRSSQVDPSATRLMRRLGWSNDFVLVVDLSIGNGAIYPVKGYDERERYKEGLYMCPMFTAFMYWLKAEWTGNLEVLPEKLCLPELNKTVVKPIEHYEGVPHECLTQQTTSAPRT